MIYHVTHTTTYQYRDPVTVSGHVLRLRPRDIPGQQCLEHQLIVNPHIATRACHVDFYGNTVEFVAIEQPHTRLVIRSFSRVSTLRAQTFDRHETPAWEQVRDLTRGCQIGAALEASEFLFNSPLVTISDDFADYAARSFTKGRPALDALLDLTERIHDNFTFDPRATTVATPVAAVLKSKRGVCQDFAHLQIACLRSLGLPARYVSGYLETFPPPGKEKLVGSDASHAWVSFYCHGLGWVDVDPTNNLVVGRRHVTLGWGRDYNDVSPVRGVILGSGEHEVKVAVDVQPGDEERDEAK